MDQVLTKEQARVLSAEINEAMTALLRARAYAADKGLASYAGFLDGVTSLARTEVNRLCGIADLAPVLEARPQTLQMPAVKG